MHKNNGPQRPTQKGFGCSVRMPTDLNVFLGDRCFPVARRAVLTRPQRIPMSLPIRYSFQPLSEGNCMTLQCMSRTLGGSPRWVEGKCKDDVKFYTG